MMTIDEQRAALEERHPRLRYERYEDPKEGPWYEVCVPANREFDPVHMIGADTTLDGAIAQALARPTFGTPRRRGR